MKKLLIILILLAFIPTVYADMGDLETIIVTLDDGSIELRPISDYETDVIGLLKASSIGTDTVLLAVQSEPNVVAASRNKPLYLAEIPTDINVSDDWRFDVTNMDNLWNVITDNDYVDTSVIVAVLDTGIKLDHPDLNLVTGYDVYSNDPDPTDFNGHGTHVAGTIGAKRDSGADHVVGIAPNVKIMPVKVFSDGGAGTVAALVNGIKYAVDNNVDVINMSLSYDGYDVNVQTQIDRAEAAGIIVVAATSNDSNHWISSETFDQFVKTGLRSAVTMSYPSAFPTVLSVGSIAYDSSVYGISDFSNISGSVEGLNGSIVEAFVDVVAPGTEIASSSHTDDNNYVVKSGTSMATPHVAGLAALMKSDFPTLSAEEIRNVIMWTAYDPSLVLPDGVDRTAYIGSGVIDVAAAINFSPISNLTGTDLTGFTFDKDVYSYSISVDSSVTSVDFSGTVYSGTTLKLNTVAIDDLTETVNLNAGNNTFVIEATYGGVVKTYTLNIKQGHDSVLLSDISLESTTITGFGENTYNYTLSGIILDDVDLVPTIKDGSSTIEYKIDNGSFLPITSGDPLNIVFDQPIKTVEFKVTSALSFEMSYVLTLVRTGDSDLSSVGLLFKDDINTLAPYTTYTFDKDTIGYTLDIDEFIDTVDVTYVKSDALSLVTYSLNNSEHEPLSSGASLTLVSGTNTLEVTNTYGALSDSNYLTKTYTYTLNEKVGTKLSDLDVTLSSVSQMTFEEGTLTYNIELPTGSSEIVFNATDFNNYATLTLSYNAIVDEAYTSGTNKTITYTTSDVLTLKVSTPAETVSYNIYVDNIVSDDSTLTDLSVGSETLIPNFDPSVLAYTLFADYATTDVDVIASANNGFATLNVNSQGPSPQNVTTALGDTVIPVVVTAEDGSDTTYTITVVRADTELSGVVLTFKDDATTMTPYTSYAFNSGTYAYDFDVNADVDTLQFDTSRIDSNAIIEINVNGSGYTSVSADQAIVSLVSSNTLLLKVSYGTSGQPTYKETIYTYTIDLLNGTGLSDLSLLVDSDEQLTFDVNTLTYNIEVLDTTTLLKFDATKLYSGASMVINDSVRVNEAYVSGNLDIPFSGSEIIILKVSIGGEETIYTINVTSRALSTDATLSSLSVTGQTITPSFDGATLAYSSSVANSVSNVTVNTARSSSYSTSKIDNENILSKSITLAVGSNSVNIVVTAEDSSTKTYTLTITRAAPVVVTPPPVVVTPPPSGGGVVIPPPVVTPPEDQVESTTDASGDKLTVVTVSEARIIEDRDNDEKDVIEVLAESEGNTEVSLDQNTLRAIQESEKPIEIIFSDVTFQMDKEILKDLNLKDSLNISLKTVSLGADSTRVSDVYELDLFDGDKKVAKIVRPIPIVFDYDRSKIKNANDLAIYYYDETTEEWVYVGGKLLSGNKIRFEARHFSKYAIREYKKTFDDIQNHWARGAIETLASREITSGVSEQEFAPEKTLTNAEFIVLVTKVLGIPEYEGSIPYVNVHEGDWFESFFKKAFNAGLLINTFGTGMDPNQEIKREEMASILMSAYFYYTKSDPEDLLVLAVEFANDEDQVTSYYRKSVRMTYQLGLIVGDNNNNFNPLQNATRAEAAIVIEKLLKLLDLL